MQTDNRLFDDLARVANGAINTLSGVREEIESRLRERVESWLTEMDMVPREEFEAVREVAQKARAEQEDLAAKVAALEKQIAAMQAASPSKGTASKSTASKRPAAKKAAAKSPAKAAAKPATRRRAAEPKSEG